MLLMRAILSAHSRVTKNMFVFSPFTSNITWGGTNRPTYYAMSLCNHAHMLHFVTDSQQWPVTTLLCNIYAVLMSRGCNYLKKIPFMILTACSRHFSSHVYNCLDVILWLLSKLLAIRPLLSKVVNRLPRIYNYKLQSPPWVFVFPLVSALEVRFSRWGAIQIYVYLYPRRILRHA